MGQLPKNGTSIQQESHSQVVKKKYASPRLMEYGSLAKLTQAKPGNMGDGVATTKACL